MMRNPAKSVLSLLLALLLLAAMPVTAFADQFDLAKTGSISIQLRDIYHPDKTIGGTIRLHKVGDAAVQNSALAFVPTAEFAGSGASLANINAAGLAEELLTYADQNKIAGTKVKANDDGKANFSGLAAGLYLVSQETAVSGYYKVSPFLVSLPMYEADSGWRYNIQAAPKVQRPPNALNVTVRKDWLDNNKNRPDELIVQLLQDDQVVEEVVLNQKNAWKHTWKDLNGYYEWDVQEKAVPEGYRASYSRSGNQITITNRASWYIPPSDLLIQTGQLNWPVPILFGLGLMFLLLGLVLLKRRDDYRHET